MIVYRTLTPLSVVNKHTYIQCRHLIPALNAWEVRAYYTTVRPIDSFMDMDAWITFKLNVDFIS